MYTFICLQLHSCPSISLIFSFTWYFVISKSGKEVIHNMEVICSTGSSQKSLTSSLHNDIIDINKMLKSNYRIHHTECTKESLWSSPRIIHRGICRLLESRRKGKVYQTSAVMVISNDLEWRDSRVPEYIVNLFSSLGIPSITWLPSQLGQILFEEGPMILRLEPSNKHLAEATFDFLQTYNWNMAVLVLNLHLSGSSNFVQMLNEVVVERQSPNHPKHFKLDLVDEIYFNGLKNPTEIGQVVSSQERMSSYKESIEHVLAADHRIIIFYGMKFDLMIMHKIAMSDKSFSKIFGAEYIWIVCPEAISPTVSVMNKKEKFTPTLELFEDLPPLPGIFGFAYVPTTTTLKETLNIAAKVWVDSIESLADKLLLQSNSSKEDMVKNMLPNLHCNSNLTTNTFWKYGEKVYKSMQESSMLYSSEYYKFSDHKYINKTEFLVMNTRSMVDDSGMSRFQSETQYITLWYKVGSWKMSSQYNEKRTKFQIDGVTWPGGANKPPLGRPLKFRLRVSTLQEEPFVIFSAKQEKTCGNNAISCYVHYDSLEIPQIEWENLRNNVTVAYMNNKNYTDACCTGMAIDILRELMKDLNFEVELYEVPDRKWGTWTPENGWNGLLESLINKKADMTVTAFKITPNRSEQVEFSVPFQETGIAIMVAIQEGSISPTAFLKPYDWASWMVILIFSVHCCGTAMFIYEWLSPTGLDRGNVPPREHKFSLFRALWLIWAMLFGAAVNVDSPRGMASKFLGCIWALFGLVFLASYTANLAAFMIAKEDYYDLKGLNDGRFLNPWNIKPEFRFATIPFSATEENIALNYPNMAVYMRRYNKSSVEEGIRALKQKEIDAFIYDSNVLEFRAAKDENCKLRTVGNLYAVTGYGIAFPKGSKWYSKINNLIMQYQRYDLLHRWKRFWLTGACKKSDKLGNTNQTLGVRNFISAFILLLLGLIISAMLLGLEHIFFRYLRPKISALDQYGCCGLISLSMGQLLSFEQTVNQTVDLVKHIKCHNPFCENHIWKLQKELDASKNVIKTLETSLNNLNASLKSLPSKLSQENKTQEVDNGIYEGCILHGSPNIAPNTIETILEKSEVSSESIHSFPLININKQQRATSFISLDSTLERPVYSCLDERYSLPQNTSQKDVVWWIERESSL